jgi:molybdenum cofactor cytidylyltransferase
LITGLLLAAGLGARFRQAAEPGSGHKLLQVLPNGETVAQQSLLNLAKQVDRVVVVQALDLSLRLPANTTCLSIPQAQQSDSLKAALNACEPSSDCLVALADMPLIAEPTYQAVIAALAQHNLVQAWCGQAAHPVGFKATLRPRVMAISGDQGLRSLMRSQPVHRVSVNDPGALFDIDTPADLLRLQSLRDLG